MSKSIKNREGVLPVGTRVRPAYAKLSKTEGEVIGHSDDGTKMIIKWDNDNTPGPSGYFMVPEVRRVN
jgi:hypothetical protein